MSLAPLPHFINLENLPNPPIDLWNLIGPPDLPRGLLPRIIEDYAFGLAHHMGSDPSGLAMAALAAASAAIPDSIKLQVKAHDPYWLESARIWTLLIGPPSSKKSPIISSAIRPIALMDNASIKRWRAEYHDWNLLSKEEKASTPAPQCKRIRLEDSTIEAAQEVFKASPEGVMSVQDEASAWFGAMEKYGSAKSASADRGFWLRAYNGGQYLVDRVGRGSIIIDNLSITFLGGIQPDPLRRIAAVSADDGLLQRMLPIILKPALAGHDETRPDVQAQYDFKIQMLPILKMAAPLRFDFQAQELRNRLERRHIDLMTAEIISPKFASHIGKFDGLFARLCIIWHAFEQDFTISPIISYTTASKVAQFMEKFIIPHVACFYRSLGLSDDHDQLQAIAEHILAHSLQSVTVRDVQRGTRAMRKIAAKDVVPILQQMTALCWLIEREGPRPSSDPLFDVNPTVHFIFKHRAETERLRREKARAVMNEYFK